MKNNSAKDWAVRYRDLGATCQLWIAAAEAKDTRIQELERECEQLRQRVARLSRLIGRRNVRRSASQVLRRSPTVG